VDDALSQRDDFDAISNVDCVGSILSNRVGVATTSLR